MRRPLVLVLLALVVAAPAAAEGKPKTAALAGTLVARSATAVSVRDGQRTLTCSLADSSPSVGAFHVGDRVKIGCANGVLVAIAATVPPKPKTPPSSDSTTQTAAGTITVLSDASVTVHSDGGDLTCSRGDGSPKLGDFHLGDRVKLACTNGVLTAIAHVDAPKPPDSSVTTFGGTITALGDHSLTVHDGDKDLTCTLGDASPKLGDFHVGDHVKLACTNGVLTTIAKVDVPTTPTPTRTGVGTITALTDGSVTFHTDGGDVTCKRTPTSQLGDAKVGDLVKFACTGDALYGVAKVTPPTPTPPPTTPPPGKTVTGGAGPIATLSADAITVTTDGGPVTCKIGPSSPATGDFHVGDRVKMYCVDGSLYALLRA